MQSFPRHHSHQSSDSSEVDTVGLSGLPRTSQKPPEVREEKEGRKAGVKRATGTAKEEGETPEGTGGIDQGVEREDKEEKHKTPMMEGQREVREARELTADSPEAKPEDQRVTDTKVLVLPIDVQVQVKQRETIELVDTSKGGKPESGGMAGVGQTEGISPVAELVEPVVLDSEQSSEELVRILVEAFTR